MEADEEESGDDESDEDTTAADFSFFLRALKPDLEGTSTEVTAFRFDPPRLSVELLHRLRLLLLFRPRLLRCLRLLLRCRHFQRLLPRAMQTPLLLFLLLTSLSAVPCRSSCHPTLLHSLQLRLRAFLRARHGLLQNPPPRFNGLTSQLLGQLFHLWLPS